MNKWLLSFKTLATALVGVLIALWLHIPLPWMLGPLILLVSLSFSSYEMHFPNHFRPYIFALIGIYLGSSVNEYNSVIEWTWLPSALLMVLLTIVSTLICGYYLVRYAKYNNEEAVLAALPGLLAFIATHAADRNLAVEKIVVPQTVRVLIVVGLAPIVYHWLTGAHAHAINEWRWEGGTDWVGDLIAIILLTLPLALLFKRKNVPNSSFIAGAVVSLATYSLGITTHALPNWLLQALLVLIGIMIGLRFKDTKLSSILLYGWHGLVSTFLLLLLTFIAAWTGAFFIDISPIALFLAFAPGGVHEMAIIAFAYAIEPVFVTFHHILRIFLISFCIPFAQKIKLIRTIGTM